MNNTTERLFQKDYENLVKILKEFIKNEKLKEVLIGKNEYSTYKYYQPLYGMAFNDAGQTDVKLLFSIFHNFIKENILSREQITESLIEASKEELDYLFIYLFIYLTI